MNGFFRKSEKLTSVTVEFDSVNFAHFEISLMNPSKERKEETWKKVLYMISNYPGPNSIHSPVKVANPS